jgi:hypothetical protein
VLPCVRRSSEDVDQCPSTRQRPRVATEPSAPAPGDASFPHARSNLGSVNEEVVPVLYVDDAARAVDWYERLGFGKEWEHQFEPGFPWFVSVARGNIHLYLSEHTGDARPNTLVHLYIDDIDRVAEELAFR